MRIIVCGGRDYDDRGTVVRLLILVAEHLGQNLTIVHGAARGADTLVGEVAGELGLEVEPHPADWKTHGKAAGPIRNQQMLDAGADLVIAFPGGKGTADMVERARKAGIVVLEVG